MINLGSIFSKSPFKPLMEHMEQVVQSVTPLPNFFEALHHQKKETLESLRQKVDEAEEAADAIKNDIRNHLPHSVFLPIDRRDLLAVLDMQDSIADTSQDIVNLLTLRQMELPESLWEILSVFVDKNVRACKLAQEISVEFEALVESGFGRHHADQLLGHIEQIGPIEHEADELERSLTKKLFAMEDDMKPVDVIFWYEIFQQIGDISDYAEKMANRLRLLIAK